MDEAIPTPEVQPTPQAPAPTQEATPSSPPSIDLNTTVKVDGHEVPLADVIDGFRHAGSLAEYRQHASSLMNPETLAPQEREHSMRYLLSAEGYSPTQIEEHIEASRTAYEGMEDMEADVDPGQQSQAPLPTEDEAARNQIAKVQHQQNKMVVDMLKKDLDGTLDRVMEQNPTVQNLLNKSRQLAGEEGFGERQVGIRQEIQRVTLDLMRQRRNRGERFDKSWFDQETSKAADTVYQRIRSVIGDPDKVQRAPETASGTDHFRSTPPVPTPTFESGDNMGTATDKAHDFTVDTLSRLALDLSAGGESRI